MKALMRPAFVKFILVALSVLSTQILSAKEKEEKHADDGGIVDTEEEISEYILHHIKDAHDFHLFSYTNSEGERKHVGFPLPVIVYTSEGVKAFMSSEFHHDDSGHHVVKAGEVHLVKYHEKIYELEHGAHGLEFDHETHKPKNAKAVLDFSITKSVFGILLVGGFMLFAFGGLARQYKKNQIPTGFARFLEPLVLYVRDEIARPNIGEKKYRKFTGYLMTVFFFIWILNLVGLTPLGFNVTGQIAVTFCLALFTFLITNISGTKDYWGHIFWMPGVPVLMKILLIPIELLGTLTKPFALMVRLFANISAGHIVMMSLIAITFTLKASMGVVGSSLISIVLSFFITLIEVLVAFLQAYIFTMLSALFIGLAVEEHEH